MSANLLKSFGMSRISISFMCLIVCLCWSLLLAVVDSQNITHPDEVKALKSIKKSLNDPFGNLRSWKSGDPCTSNWTGILCFNRTMRDGFQHVKELQLLNMNLSGTLSPDLGRLSYLEILDFMWNGISGSIPKEIGSITSLQLLLLNGNQLTGSLPDEIGNLTNLNRIQIDQNQISGPIPKSFARMTEAKHFHMNNNSLSGQIPAELARLPKLVHLLLDNNNLSGYLPPELSEFRSLWILQLDNNNFSGTEIPPSYGNMSKLIKLSLRNCGLVGQIPDMGNMSSLAYIDVSFNSLTGPIPLDHLSSNMTTVDFSFNDLSGDIPDDFTGLPLLQKLSLENNNLSGSVSSTIWQNRTSYGNSSLILDLQNNKLSNISGSLHLPLPQNVTVRLQGNPVCTRSDLNALCGSQTSVVSHIVLASDVTICRPQSCPDLYRYAPASPTPCFCALPLLVGYRLKSPAFSDFGPYENAFEDYISSGLDVYPYQLDIGSPEWEEGPRLRFYLSIFPVYNKNTSMFNKTEVIRIRSMFTGWRIPESEVFGPYELLNFTLIGPYKDEFPTYTSSGISKGAIAGIVIGALAVAALLLAIVVLLLLRSHYKKKHHAPSKPRHYSKISIKIDGVKEFSYQEMASSTSKFDSSSLIGQGGYGKVYKGILGDGTLVAIKCAQEGSLQGEKEFLTEIELLSRLHHRNLVSLLGYYDEEGEQMLIYEYMANGSLRDHLSGKSQEPLNFAMRLKIALGSAKGILYLHTEADPPIFHRDIKASNILLDSKFTAKVADFGLSRFAPVPDLDGTMPAPISTVVKGTPGYLDPEYFLTHKLTDKSDVYSLGVVFLELLTGMHPISHGKNLVREVKAAYHAGMIFSVIDDRMGSYPSECVEKFITLALKCCQEETNSRPSMSEVVRELESIWLMMPEYDAKLAESVVTDPDRDTVTPPSVPSTTTNPYVSSDVSGSDLVSGVVPTIKPR